MNKYFNKSIVNALTFLNQAKAGTDSSNHAIELANLCAAKHEIENAIHVCRKKLQADKRSNNKTI